MAQELDWESILQRAAPAARPDVEWLREQAQRQKVVEDVPIQPILPAAETTPTVLELLFGMRR